MLFGYTLFHSYNKGVRNKIFEKKVFFIDGVCFCVEVFGWKHAPFRLSSGDFVLHKFSHPSWSLTCTSNTHTRTLTHTNTHKKPLHRQTHTHTNTHSLSFQQSHQFVGSNAYSYTQPECLLHKYIGRRGIFKAFVNISFSITVYSIEYSEDTETDIHFRLDVSV